MNNFAEMLKVLTEKKDEESKCDSCKKCKATKDVKVKGKTKKLCSSCVKECKSPLKEAEETSEKVDYSEKTISQLASIIRKDWGKVYYSAVPYLNAMRSLEKITDKYEMDSGRSVVTYFLANASQWKGDVARAIKKELNKRLGGKK